MNLGFLFAIEVVESVQTRGDFRVGCAVAAVGYLVQLEGKGVRVDDVRLRVVIQGMVCYEE